jgi:hypothetical protein
MERQQIAESIRFNADEIAMIMDDAEWVQKNGTSEYQKECAQRSAYEHIAELIFGEGR